jgi:DNA-binding helix-hairpin-helix protein with protein kinase domain
MIELQPGDEIQLEDRDEAAVVIEEIGRGGQGIVYKVDLNGKTYALKWYNLGTLNNVDDFRKNITQNIFDGAPSPSFLWPKYLSKMQKSSFGYLMDIRPKGFYQLSDILNKKDKNGNKVEFAGDWTPIITAALNIVNSFRALHRKGKSYQDLNDGNFFINTNTGDVLICDNDNVAPDMKNLGIGGKPGYMAPEIVRADGKPNTLTDQHSLAVILFKLFMRHDPFMGKKFAACVCLTEDTERKLYGEEPIFIFDPKDSSNSPIVGVHPNPIKLWPYYPNYIQQAFIKTFCDGVKNPNERLPDNEWQKILIRFRDDVVTCNCGNEIIVSLLRTRNTFKCDQCGMVCSYPMQLHVKDFFVNLFPRNKLYLCHTNASSDDFNTITGQIVQNKNNPSIWGIRNMSGDEWITQMANDKASTVQQNSVAPIVEALRIKFSQTLYGTIERR